MNAAEAAILAIGFGRDHRGDFSVGQCVAERIGIVRLVAEAELSGHYLQRKEAKVETTQSSLASIVAQLTARGNGDVHVVAASGSGAAVTIRESREGKKTCIVPINITEPYAVLREVVSTEE
jgi:hypothetical protein